MKVCSTCKQEKSLEDFTVDKRRGDGRGSHCYSCHRLRNTRYYADNRQARRDYNIQYTEEVTLRKRKILLDWLKDNPCVNCGESDIAVLQCDHINPNEKDHSIAFLVTRPYAEARLIEELKKCRSLCANCHMRWTAEQFGFWRSKETAVTPMV